MTNRFISNYEFTTCRCKYLANLFDKECVTLVMILWGIPCFAEGQNGMGTAFFIVILIFSILITVSTWLILKLIFRLVNAKVSNKLKWIIAGCVGIVYFIILGKWIFGW